MRNIKNLIVVLLLFCFALPLAAQSDMEDWTYEKTAVKERKVIPHRYTREGNVRFHKRIHRVIDTREKQNLPMHWPRNAFFNVIYDAATDPDSRYGNVTPYTSDSLDLGGQFTLEELEGRGGYEFITSIPDPMYPGEYKDTTIIVPFEPRNIKKYRIMEDWIFDHNYSDFRATIVAIAPLFEQMVNGSSIGEAKLFWVKMDEFRPILVNQEIFNPFNDASRLSFDDWFEMRMFSSYIVKESNVWDLDIKYMEEYEDDGLAALLKSEEIKNDLFIFEHDLWEY
ncbi:MAG: gliding motility associated protein GldN [Bacteroidia bacterium]|jgi:gliding motility associated protien GldN